MKRLNGEVIPVVNRIIERAIRHKAEVVQIAVRPVGSHGKNKSELVISEYVNGHLEEMVYEPLKATAIKVRLKILADLTLSEHRRVQIGSFDFVFGKTSLSIRVIVLPDGVMENKTFIGSVILDFTANA